MTHPNPGPAPAPKRRGLPTWAIVLIVIGAACVVGTGVAGVAAMVAAVPSSTQATRSVDTDGPISNSGNRENPPIEDVALNGCDIDEFGWTTATMEVTNNSSKASDYHITVEVVDKGDSRLDEMFTFIEALRPGQSSEVEANGLEDVSGASGVTCIVLSVERYAAE